ncbi:uncharacterized protein JCM15063_001971 [Sporobolomyces koalae]|uniref:uncharacterized protein n=1 Tax=Sporobolomyces koalae TaxID=500713 RepID=UPI003180D470
MDDPFRSPQMKQQDQDGIAADFPQRGAMGPSSASSASPRPPPNRNNSNSGRAKSPEPNPTRPASRMSQVRQSSGTSSSPTISSSRGPYSAKPSGGQPKRFANDRSKRSSRLETQSITSQQSRPVQQIQEPTAEELVRFAALCRRQYYDNDAGSARKVGELLAKLPPSSVAFYSRAMANVRSEYHRDKEVERRIQVETVLESMMPGSTVKQALGVSLEDGMGGGVAAMRSSKARQIRRRAFKAFVDANCVKAIPGCHPFFRGLFAALWLQSINSSRGGAGIRRVEWEVDVAVFTEAGGGEAWARDAVEALKGILGMSERIKEPVHTDTFRSSIRSESINLIDAIESEASPSLPSLVPVTENENEPPSKREPPAVPPHRPTLARNRSSSDPFCDPRDQASDQAPSAEAASSDFIPPDLSVVTASTPFLTASSPASPGLSETPVSSPDLPASRPARAAPAVPSALEPQVRIFTVPSYLTNPELRSLCRLFPEFVATPARTGARFRSSSLSSADRTKAQTEAGVNAGGKDGPAAKVGHGDLRIGAMERDTGWSGTWWQRLVEWLKALF